jgi:hypothetical protein
MTNNCKDPNTRNDCETQIYNAFTQINKDYATYQIAYKKCYSSSIITTCSDTSDNTILINAINLIKNDIQNLDEYIKEYKTNFLNNDTLIDNKTQSSSGSTIFYNDIINQYNEIIQKRQKMDTQLYELYTNNSESVYSINPPLDSTILTGIIWTILATSIIYFVVIKT